MATFIYQSSSPAGYSNPTYGSTSLTCTTYEPGMNKGTQTENRQNKINHVAENLFNQVPQKSLLSFSVSQANLAF